MLLAKGEAVSVSIRYFFPSFPVLMPMPVMDVGHVAVLAQMALLPKGTQSAKIST
ncbi:MAG: hypothetical protein ACXW4Q_04385 [Anaerolineales bacterium]